MLALAAVLAVLVPAAAVVSLDVVREAPDAGSGTLRGPDGPAFEPVRDQLAVAAQRRTRALAKDRRHADAVRRAAEVPTTVVDPVVDEVALDPSAATSRQRRPSTDPVTQVVSAPEPVTGFGTVGVTWAPGTDLAEEALTVEVRTRTDGTWSGWQAMEYHDDHGADPGSAEAARERPGTDEALIGHVDDVQVKVAAAGVPLPDDLSLAVIDPGKAPDTATEAPALHEPAGASSGSSAGGSDGSDGSGGSGGSGGEALQLSAASTQAAQPTVYSRAQWGADERIREQGNPLYGVIKGGFVHHTVNANDYTADEVPAIIRSVYAYHVKSRGWRDIGYNFLVDRFGRIWEGRYGGIDRPVIGAHTSGYNDESFAMAAIGNFETAQPTAEMLTSYAQLFAWKLAISGVSAAATGVAISGSTFASSIMGHRDAGQTACPGINLYNQLPAIRSMAVQAQAGMTFGPDWTGRSLASDLAGSTYPDLVVRRTVDNRGVIIATDGMTRFAATKVSSGWKSARRVLVTPDITGDGRSDLLLVSSNGTPRVRSGNGAGTFKKIKAVSRAISGSSLLTAVGDLDRDKRNDLVGRTSSGRLTIFSGQGKRGFTARTLAGSWAGFTLIAGAGDVTGDRRDDVVARDKRGKLWLFKATKSGLAKRTKVAGSWGRYDAILGGGDYDGDGRADLVGRRGKTGEVFLHPGLGKGAFGAPVGPIAKIKGDELSAASVGSDTRVDLVVRSGNKLVRYDNAGTHETSAPIETNLDLTGATAVLNAGDFDRDGLGDVIVRDAAGTLTLRSGLGGGSFAAPVTIGTGFGAVTDLGVSADRTGDANPDLVGSIAGVATVWTGQARGAVSSGRADPSYVKVPAGSDLTAYDWVVPISDGDGDGVPDVLARRPGSGQLVLLPGTGNGLGAPRLVAGGLQPYDLAG